MDRLRLNAVTEPETWQRALRRHAVDPTFLRAVTDGRFGTLEDIFDVVEHRQCTLLAACREHRRCRHRTPSLSAQATSYGEFFRQLVARRASCVSPVRADRTAAHSRQVAFSDRQRLTDLAVVLSAQVARRARPWWIGKQLQGRSFAEAL